jgi:uncharacterized lipoprotein YbaY
MTKLRLFPSLILIVLLLAACASEQPTVAPIQPEAAEPSATAALAGTAGPAPAMEQTATPPSEALPVATSRGPDLHASDPATVSLASGGLQLVEFFRFT